MTGTTERTQRRWTHRCRRAGGVNARPLRVTCRLASPLAGDLPFIHLDALLTFAATHHAHYPGAHRPVSPVSSDRDMQPVPIPAAHDGSVWCTSVLHAGLGSPTGASWWRMRPALEYGHLLRANQVAVKHGVTRAHQGRDLLWDTTELTGWMIGDPELTGKLLARYVPSVGHARRRGYGRIREWVIDHDPAGAERWLTVGGRMTRPHPSAAGRPLGVLPPYWYRPWWTPAVDVGDPTPDNLASVNAEWFMSALGSTPVPA